MQRSSVDFPQPGRSDQAHHLVLVDGEVDAAQHLVVAEALVHVAELDERTHLRLRAFLVDADQVVDETRAPGS